MAANDNGYSIDLTFPGDLGYIPPVRKFVSEMLQANNFTPKFAYRSEIIVDEICNNAVSFGCKSIDATVALQFKVHPDRIELVVKDQGGSREDRERLRELVGGGKVRQKEKEKEPRRDKLGLEIVKMLSESIDLEIDDNNLTSVRVVRKRDDMEIVENKD
jgi:anti-sigma regulatory factor (Ser/Thr protein kinase)